MRTPASRITHIAVRAGVQLCGEQFCRKSPADPGAHGLVYVQAEHEPAGKSAGGVQPADGEMWECPICPAFVRSKLKHFNLLCCTKSWAPEHEWHGKLREFSGESPR